MEAAHRERLEHRLDQVVSTIDRLESRLRGGEDDDMASVLGLAVSGFYLQIGIYDLTT